MIYYELLIKQKFFFFHIYNNFLKKRHEFKNKLFNFVNKM